MVVRARSAVFYLHCGQTRYTTVSDRNSSEKLRLKMAKLSLKYLSKEVNLSNQRGNLDKTLTPLLPFPISF